MTTTTRAPRTAPNDGIVLDLDRLAPGLPAYMIMVFHGRARIVKVDRDKLANAVTRVTAENWEELEYDAKRYIIQMGAAVEFNCSYPCPADIIVKAKFPKPPADDWIFISQAIDVMEGSNPQGPYSYGGFCWLIDSGLIDVRVQLEAPRRRRRRLVRESQMLKI
jgi:hypothetical protein